MSDARRFTAVMDALGLLEGRPNVLGPQELAEVLEEFLETGDAQRIAVMLAVRFCGRVIVDSVEEDE